MGDVMPPRCYVCGLGLDDLSAGADERSCFTLVSFELDADEQAEQAARDAAGADGHPLGGVWFCRDHVGLAESRVGLHWREALIAIDTYVSDDR
jgi:hypothetical protein